MGEVIEINIVSHEKCQISHLLRFISLQMKDSVIKRTIEIMDNWQYENVFEVADEMDIEDFVDTKIISITEMMSMGQAGVNIESLNGYYTYCIWFNGKYSMSDIEYIELIKHFIDYACNIEMIDKILIGAIGKESIFEYLKDIKKTINTSHNIDVWILDKRECVDNALEDCNVLEFQKKQLISKEKRFFLKNNCHLKERIAYSEI